MKKQIVYYVSGPAHLPYLLVSLWTLRRYWNGPVKIYAWPQSLNIVLQIVADDRLGKIVVEERPEKPDDRINYLNGRKRQALDRISLMPTETAISLYLDCDTTIHGDVSPLLERAEGGNYVATQWNDWITQGRMIGKRIRSMKQFPEIDQTWVDQLLNRRLPSLNCGVVAWHPDSLVPHEWFKWSLIAAGIFIPDEVTQHLAMIAFPSRMSVASGNGRWNSSPHLKSEHLPHDDVVIYHYHGSSNCRPEKSPRGCELWLPLYDECWRKNVGGLQDWRGSVKNKHLDKVRLTNV